jgi:hypothetical protein
MQHETTAEAQMKGQECSLSGIPVSKAKKMLSSRSVRSSDPAAKAALAVAASQSTDARGDR